MKPLSPRGQPRRDLLLFSVIALMLGLHGLVSHADDTPPMLGEIRVTAQRTAQDVDEIAGTVSVIDAEQIQRQMATDIRDMLRYEPGVSVRSEPYRPGAAMGTTGRGGNEGINIRGLEGNQILLQTDGVRIPAAFSFGPQQTGRGDYLEIEGYKNVELLRGPASVLYGSDGLGGAVGFMTKDVDDLLSPGRQSQFGIRTGYHSVNRGWLMSPSFAARGERFEGLLLAAFRDYGETRNAASNRARNAERTAPNPQDADSRYWLGKLRFRPDTTHAFELTAEHLDRRTETHVLSGIAPVPVSPTSVTDLNTEDTIKRERISLGYRYANADNPLFQFAHAGIHVQRSDNRQFSDERRNAAPDRTRDNRYSEDLIGGSVQFESHFGDAIAHRLIYGLDADAITVAGKRDGTVPGAGGSFPDKPFPDTDYRLVGAFVQDEIAVGDLLVIPGLRFDSFKLDPEKNDPRYRGETPATLSDSTVSKRLGLVWKAHPFANPFFQYAEGFRAPTPDDVNNGFSNLTNPFAAYRTIANPNLRPEQSRSYEIGLRGDNGTMRYSASAYHNRYRDFIELTQVGGTGTIADPLTFQSVNLSRARIDGIELTMQWQFARHWSLLGSASMARGDGREDGEWTPLMTIDPAKLVVGIRHDVDDRYGGEAMLTAVEGKRRPHDDDAFRPSGFATLDLTGYYQFTPNARLNVGLFNVFDRKHFLWADTRSVTADSEVRDAFSQPGRNFAVSFDYRF